MGRKAPGAFGRAAVGFALGLLATAGLALPLFGLAVWAGGFESVGVILFVLGPLLIGALVGVVAGRWGWLTAALAACLAYAVGTPMLERGTYTMVPSENPLLRLPMAVPIVAGIAAASLGGWLGASLKGPRRRATRWVALALVGLCVVYPVGRRAISQLQARAFKRNHLPALIARIDREFVRLTPDLSWRKPEWRAADGAVVVKTEWPAGPDDPPFVMLVVDQWGLVRGKRNLKAFLWYEPIAWRGEQPRLGRTEAAARLEALGARPRIARLVRREGRAGRGGVSVGPYPGTAARPYVAVGRWAAIAVGRFPIAVASDFVLDGQWAEEFSAGD